MRLLAALNHLISHHSPPTLKAIRRSAITPPPRQPPTYPISVRRSLNNFLIFPKPLIYFQSILLVWILLLAMRIVFEPGQKVDTSTADEIIAILKRSPPPRQPQRISIEEAMLALEIAPRATYGEFAGQPLKPEPLQPRNIQTILPPEVLTQIFEFVTEDAVTMFSVRLVSRSFEAAVWSPYAKSFNNNVIRPTVRSLKALRLLARHPTFVRHLKFLNIGTVRSISDLRYVYLMSGVPPPTGQTAGLPNVSALDDLEERGMVTYLLIDVLTKLKNIETVSVVDGREAAKDRTKYNYLSNPVGNDRVFPLNGQFWDRKAHRFTLEIVLAALSEPLYPSLRSVKSGTFLPKLRSFVTAGRMNVMGLPGCGCRVSDPPERCVYARRMTGITSLTLEIEEKMSRAERNETRRLPFWATADFLAMFPNLIHLTLDFAHPYIHELDKVPVRNTDNLFGSRGFRPIADTNSFPNLKSLHVAHIVGAQIDFRRFLEKHAKTLTELKLTSVFMSSSEWWSLQAFLKNSMALQSLTLASDLTLEELVIEGEMSAQAQARSMPTNGQWHEVAARGCQWATRHGRIVKDQVSSETAAVQMNNVTTPHASDS